MDYFNGFTLYFSSVRDFLEAGVKKMIAIFPLASETLKLAPVAKPENRDRFTAPEICKLAQSFSIDDATTIDKLSEEWVEFQLDNSEV